MKNVVIENGKIVIDGKAQQIISGAIHYFRVLPELWEDRLLKAKQCGLNTIETYMCWNLHEPKQGEFDFAGLLDIVKFIEVAQSLGLWVIVRPGPYICSEWENGGLPSWLMMKEGLRFRCMNEPYITALEPFLVEVTRRLKKLQYTENGPVIAMQVENEYGSFGNDHEYIRHVRQIFLDQGITVPLFTSDGPADWYIQGGTIPELTMTLNFGSDPEGAFATGRQYRPEGPDFCMEFWNGWFDHWGEKHHVRGVEDATNTLEKMLKMGASVNFYMFHGGTNFNFWNGANLVGNRYQPTITSYDYDAALSECGDPTEKYFAFQSIIKKYNQSAKLGKPEPSRKIAYGNVVLTESAKLLDRLDVLGEKHTSATPESMEFWGQDFGFIHYRTQLRGPLSVKKLCLDKVHDRALVFLDGKHFATSYRNDEVREFDIEIPASGVQLEILVENMGRINYGIQVGKDFKGILDGVRFGPYYHFHWDTWTLPLNNIEKLCYQHFNQEANQPAFHKGTLEVDEVADTFLVFPGKKGSVWVNGFNMGRYWEVGPQKALYVPSALLKKGANEIVVFELHELVGNQLKFVDQPDLGESGAPLLY